MGELDEGERKTLRTDCIFRTDKYENGCSALDTKKRSCSKCAFYKNEEMQKQSLESAERLYAERCADIYVPQKLWQKVWTAEEEYFIIKNQNLTSKELAKRLGVTVGMLDYKKKKMEAQGIL